MRHCLIFPFGGETKWIDLSIRDYPDLEWILIIANDVSDNPSRKSKMDYYRVALDYVLNRRKLEINYPERQQKQYNVLKMPNLRHNFEFLAYFRNLILILKSKGFERVSIHLNSGLMAWRIALYQCAEEFHTLITNPFLYDKDTDEIEQIRLYRDFSDIEQNIIGLLSNVEKISLSDLTTLYTKTYESKTLSYILKIVNNLREAGLVTSAKEGRIKTVALSLIGRELFSNTAQQNYSNTILRDLEI